MKYRAVVAICAACVVPQASPSAPPAAARDAPTTNEPPTTAAALDMPAAADPTTQACRLVDRAIASWQNIQAAYDALLPQALQNNWNGDKYDAAVTAYVNAHAQGGVGGSEGPGAHTDMCKCTTTGIDELCAANASRGLPPVICDAEKAHEATHRQQCEHNKTLPAGDPDKWTCNPDDTYQIPPRLRDRDEHAAYDAVLKILDAYVDAHCLHGCKQLVKAKAWQGSISIRYLRTNLTNYTDERLDGGAIYTSALTKPMAQIGVNGYDVLWMGNAHGTAQLEDVEHQTSGGKPYEGHGSGPLLADPHGVDFGPEILRIDEKHCRYAFEPFAAIDSTWQNGRDTHPESIHVQLGGMTIDSKARTLVGGQTLTLPISHFDWPGPAVRLPNDPVDWKARGKIGGWVQIAWQFWPS